MTSEVIPYFMKTCVVMMLAFIEILYQNWNINECARNILAKTPECHNFVLDLEEFNFLIMFFYVKLYH